MKHVRQISCKVLPFSSSMVHSYQNYHPVQFHWQRKTNRNQPGHEWFLAGRGIWVSWSLRHSPNLTNHLEETKSWHWGTNCCFCHHDFDVKEALDWCPSQLHCYTRYKYPSYKWGFNKGVHVSEPLENLIKVLWHFALHWKKAVWESNQICENSFKMSSDQGPGKNNLYNSATVIYI